MRETAERNGLPTSLPAASAPAASAPPAASFPAPLSTPARARAILDRGRDRDLGPGAVRNRTPRRDAPVRTSGWTAPAADAHAEPSTPVTAGLGAPTARTPVDRSTAGPKAAPPQMGRTPRPVEGSGRDGSGAPAPAAAPARHGGRDATGTAHVPLSVLLAASDSKSKGTVGETRRGSRGGRGRSRGKASSALAGAAASATGSGTILGERSANVA